MRARVTTTPPARPPADTRSRRIVQCGGGGEQDRAGREDHRNAEREHERSGDVEAPGRGDRTPDDQEPEDKRDARIGKRETALVRASKPGRRAPP